MPLISPAFRYKIQKFLSSALFRTGMPFTVFLMGGVAMLIQAQRAIHSIRDQGNKLVTTKDNEEFLKAHSSTKTLSELHKETKKSVDIEDWYNIRGPREGEDPRAMQDEQRRKIRAERELQRLMAEQEEEKRRLREERNQKTKK